MDAIAGNSAPFKKGGHQEVRVKAAQFCGNDISFDRVMSAQSRIRPTHYQKLGNISLGEGDFQVLAHFARDGGGLFCWKRARIGQNKEDGDCIHQPNFERLHIPPSQQQTTMHRL
jgi:hypothetical protein